MYVHTYIHTYIQYVSHAEQGGQGGGCPIHSTGQLVASLQKKIKPSLHTEEGGKTPEMGRLYVCIVRGLV